MGTHGQKRPNWTVLNDLVYDRKLDTALITAPIRDLLNRIGEKEGNREDNLFKQLVLEAFDVDICDVSSNVNIMPLIWDKFIRVNRRDSFRSKFWTEEAIRTTILNITPQISYMYSQTVGMNENLLHDYLYDCQNITNSAYRWKVLALLVEEFTDLLDRLGKGNGFAKELHPHHFKSKILPLEIVWTRSYAAFNIDHVIYLCPKESILLMHNKTCDIFSILGVSLFSSGSVYDPDTYSVVLNFIDELCKLHLRYKDDAFDIMRCLEGIVTGMTLIEVDSWVNKDFLDSIIKDLEDSLRIDLTYEPMYSILKNVPVPLRHELGCLSKVMGHPVMSVADGVEALKDITREVIPIDPDAVLMAIRFGKESFIKNYVLRHKVWPPVTFNTKTHQALLHARNLNVDPRAPIIIQSKGGFAMEEYDNIELEKIIELDYLENAIPYLKDKAISLLRSPTMQHYLNREYFKDIKRHGGGPPIRDNLRLLLYYMLHQDSELDHVSYIKDYEASVDLQDIIDYLVIRVVPKEKELKRIFRGFGCKTFFDRLRSMAQEETMMTYLSNYCECQALTLSELEIIQKIKWVPTYNITPH